ncbi:MAG: hypothetical protein M3O34_05410 [Chloroflexota bacterium]|nr:hypothetical protein [Chloroflexota bacterium]
MRFYEVWDTDSGNLLGSSGTEWEALALVRDLSAGRPDSHAFLLVWGDEDDENLGGEIAAGGELLARARTAGSTSA